MIWIIGLTKLDGRELIFERTGPDKNTVLIGLLKEMNIDNIAVIKITQL